MGVGRQHKEDVSIYVPDKYNFRRLSTLDFIRANKIYFQKLKRIVNRKILIKKVKISEIKCTKRKIKT